MLESTRDEIPKITVRQLRSAYKYIVAVKRSKAYKDLNNIDTLMTGAIRVATLINKRGWRVADVFAVGFCTCIVYGIGAVGNYEPCDMYTTIDHEDAAKEFIGRYGYNQYALDALRLNFCSECIFKVMDEPMFEAYHMIPFDMYAVN